MYMPEWVRERRGKWRTGRRVKFCVILYCLWPSCPVYHQHPSPWRQSLTSAVAVGIKSAKKSKSWVMKCSTALLKLSKWLEKLEKYKTREKEFENSYMKWFSSIIMKEIRTKDMPIKKRRKWDMQIKGEGDINDDKTMTEKNRSHKKMKITEKRLWNRKQ